MVLLIVRKGKYHCVNFPNTKESFHLNCYHIKIQTLRWAFVHNSNLFYFFFLFCLFTNRFMNMDVAWYIYKCLCLHLQKLLFTLNGKRKKIHKSIFLFFRLPISASFSVGMFHYSMWRHNLPPPRHFGFLGNT